MTTLQARALILTAGYGTRLRPLTYDRAKAAVPVAGVPLVQRIVRWAVGCGLRDLVFNLHHEPHTIAAVVGDGAEFGARVRYSFESTLLGSAGGPRHALPLLDPQRFFIINGDTLTNLELNALGQAHTRSGADVTLAVMPHPAPDRYGGITADPDGRVIEFTRRGVPGAAWHFIGVQLVESRVFAELLDGDPKATIPDLYHRLLIRNPGGVRILPVEADYHDIGTPADYLRTCLALAAAQRGQGLVGTNCTIDPSATVERTVLWNRVRIGPGTTLIDCVVGDGVTVPPQCRFEGRAIVAARGRTPTAGEELQGGLLTTPLEREARQ